MASKRISIVGAGLAGLAAATRLRALGFDVQLLEREERVGGRATSERHEGYLFDAGAQTLGARDRALLGLVEQAGLERSLLPLRPVATAQLHEGVARAIESGGVRAVSRIPGVRRLDALRLLRLERILRRFAGILDPSEPERAARLDDRSIGDFVRLYFGKSALEYFAAPWVSSASLAEAEQASRVLWLMTLLSRRYVVEGSLRGGLQELADALAAPLETRLATSVEQVEPSSQGLALRLGGGGERLESDAVLLATPASVARRIGADLLVDAEVRYLEQRRYARAIVLHLALERPLAPAASRVRVPGSEGGAVALFALEPGVEAGRTPPQQGSASLLAREAWSRAHFDAPDEVVEKELLSDLDRLSPGASASVRFARVLRFAEAYPRFDVGSYRALERFRRVVADRRASGRRLYFAGDYLVAPTLEGAAVSGLRAAEEVAADLA